MLDFAESCTSEPLSEFLLNGQNNRQRWVFIAVLTPLNTFFYYIVLLIIAVPEDWREIFELLYKLFSNFIAAILNMPCQYVTSSAAI